MAALHPLQCCGVSEVYGISAIGLAVSGKAAHTPKDALMNMVPSYITRNGSVNKGIFLFTSAGNTKENINRYGDEFAEFIVTNKLGTISFVSEPTYNPNSTRFIKLFVWTINHKGLQEYVQANYKEQPVPPKAAAAKGLVSASPF